MTEKRPTEVSKPWYTKLNPSICTTTSGIDQHHSSPSTRRSVSSDTSLPPYSTSTSSPFPKSRQGSRTIFGFAERACTAKVELYRSVIPLKDIQLASIAETARLLTRIEVFLAKPSVSLSMSMSFSMTPAPLIMDRIAMHGQILSVILQGLERLPVSDARANHAAMRGFEGQLSALKSIIYEYLLVIVKYPVLCKVMYMDERKVKLSVQRARDSLCLAHTIAAMSLSGVVTELEGICNLLKRLSPIERLASYNAISTRIKNCERRSATVMLHLHGSLSDKSLERKSVHCRDERPSEEMIRKHLLPSQLRALSELYKRVPEPVVVWQPVT